MNRVFVPSHIARTINFTMSSLKPAQPWDQSKRPDHRGGLISGVISYRDDSNHTHTHMCVNYAFRTISPTHF